MYRSTRDQGQKGREEVNPSDEAEGYGFRDDLVRHSQSETTPFPMQDPVRNRRDALWVALARHAFESLTPPREFPTEPPPERWGHRGRLPNVVESGLGRNSHGRRENHV